MKRSPLALGLTYAAIGFVGTAAVRYAVPLQADSAVVAVSPRSKVSTKAFELAVRYNADSGQPEAVVSNRTDQAQTANWTVHVYASRPAPPESRVMMRQEEVAAEPASVTLAAYESKTVAITLPAPKAKAKTKGIETTSVTIDVNGQSLVVPTAAERTETASR